MLYSAISRTSNVFLATAWLLFFVSACSVADYPSITERSSPGQRDEQVAQVRSGLPLIAGCRVPGCCPGCAKDDMLSWHLHVDGPPGAQVVLEFEQHGSLPERLRVEGDARWRDDHTLLVPAGESRIYGLPSHSATSPMVALPHVIAPEATTATVRSLDQSVPATIVRFTVVQYLGQVPVNHSEMVFDLRDLPLSTTKIGDMISLHNNRQGDSAIILVDGWRETGFVNDEVHRAVDSVNVGNLLATLPECESILDRLEIKRQELLPLDVSPPSRVPERDNNSVLDADWLPQELMDLEKEVSACERCPFEQQCNPEVIVFSNGDAMALNESVDVWTSSPTDVFYARLGSAYKIPVTFWILSAQAADPREFYEQATARILSDQLRANQIYEEYNCGIAFTTAAIQHITDDFGSTIPLGQAECTHADRLRNEAGYVQNHLNVYYLSEYADDFDAIACGAYTIMVTPASINETLAHEYGHWLGLGHIDKVDLDNNGVPDFPSTNLMRTGSMLKYDLTEGQCFRVHADPRSVVNIFGLRSGPTRTCYNTDVNVLCPAITLDVKPD